MLKNISTKSKLFFLTLSQLVIFLLLMFILLSFLEKAFINHTKNDLNNISTIFANLINENFINLTVKLNVLKNALVQFIESENLDKYELKTNKKELQKFLDNRILAHSIFPNEILILDKRGKLIVESPLISKDRIGIDLSHREYFKETMRLQAPYISKTYVSTGLKEPAFMITYPIIYNNNVIGILAANISLKKDNILKTIIMGLNYTNKESLYNIYICEDTGRVIFHRDFEKIGKVHKNYKSFIYDYRVHNKGFVKTHYNHTDYFISIKKLDADGFYLFLEQPSKEALSTFYIFRMSVFILTVLFFIIFILSMSLSIDKFLQPFYTVSEYLQSIKEKDPANYRQFYVKTNNKEAKILIQVFNYIIKNIKERSIKMGLLTEVIENNIAGIIITNSNFTIIYVNKTYEIISGYLKEDLLGRDLIFLKDVNMPDKKYNEILSNLIRGSCYYGESQKTRKNGKEYTEYTQACPVFDKDGKLNYIIITKLDITKKKLLEKNNI